MDETTPMTSNRIILPLLSLALLTACIDEHDSGAPEASRSGEIDRLVLANGNLLIFLDEDPSDAVGIGLLEVAATPEPGGAIEELKAARATPAELWLSMSDKEIPRALADAHADEHEEAPRAFSMPEHLREVTDDVDFRAFAYGGAWGGGAGYCNTSFASDWDSWSGAAATQTTSGTVGGGGTGPTLFMSSSTDAWVGVCNTGSGSGLERSKMLLFRDTTGGPFWSALTCSVAPSATFCTVIFPEEGVGMHWWSGTSYPYKAQAEWSGGEPHTALLRVR